jgi:histone H3/H4
MIKKHGAKRVSDDAAKALAAHLEEEIKRLALESAKIAKHSDRTTILRRDVKLAQKVIESS